MADFLEDKKREISERMTELRPAVDEYHRLEAAHRALEGVSDDGDGGGRRSGGSSRSGGGTRRSGSGTGQGRGRPKGSGARADQARKIVTESPGITIPEMAQKMGIQQNYLYRVLPDLEQRGDVRKEGRGWYPKDAA
jgi:hypothetical protein